MHEITLSNKEKFALEISRIKKKHSLSSFDAILHFCEENECDVEDILAMLDRTTKEELKQDAIKENRVQQKYIDTRASLFE